ncbi:hypothetical protein MPLDJ20_320059 [Mesorhizobium plurifarium]|uniref:Uncharacterized protein n=1 Tax=Mesorhizobium plurifarium TaxID=69974 RepID=A0A090FHN3_MESPL|nr:hypothetical protein MPLDJ20_320059 [Mesorhizobium plurifarium]
MATVHTKKELFHGLRHGKNALSTCFAARFSGLCQETVKTGTAVILAAYRAIRVKMRPTRLALEQAGQRCGGPAGQAEGKTLGRQNTPKKVTSAAGRR